MLPKAAAGEIRPAALIARPSGAPAGTVAAVTAAAAAAAAGPALAGRLAGFGGFAPAIASPVALVCSQPVTACMFDLSTIALWQEPWPPPE